MADGIDEYGEQSIYSRIGIPYLRALPKVIDRAPVFGVGVGGKRVLTDWADDSRADESEEWSVGTNAFVRVFLFYGLLGGLVYFWLFYRYLKANRIRYLVLFAGVWCVFANTTGALESPRFWTYTGFLVSAFWWRSQVPARRVLGMNGPSVPELGAPIDSTAHVVS